MNEGYVVTRLQGHVATIEFAHPQSNSLPGKLLSLLADHIIDAGAKSHIQCIVLQSGGNRVFCAGASFEELTLIEDIQSGKKFFKGFAGVINAIRTCGKIVIVRIQGKAVGGGVGIAAAADIAIATQNAAIRLSELAVGIGPFVIGPAVERKVGIAAFTYLSLTPDEWQNAEWALDKGLYNRLFDSVEEMDEYIKELTSKFSQYNPEAIQQLKQVFWKGTENWDSLLDERAEISGQLVLSTFTKEAIAKFKKS